MSFKDVFNFCIGVLQEAERTPAEDLSEGKFAFLKSYDANTKEKWRKRVHVSALTSWGWLETYLEKLKMDDLEVQEVKYILESSLHSSELIEFHPKVVASSALLMSSYGQDNR